MASDQSQLQNLHYKASRLEKKFGALQRTIDQIESMGGNTSSSIVGKKTLLLGRLHKMRDAAHLDDNELKSQRITIDQQTRLIDAIRKELVSLQQRVTNYMKSNNNNSNNDDAYTAFRKTMRNRLLLLKSELEDHFANEEGAFISHNDGNNVCVTYWNGRGLCEPLRVMLAAGGISFKNKFLTKPSDLKKLQETKGKLFYQQVPLVEIDGMCLNQSGAAMRYIARRCGMYGDSDKERYLIDLIYEGSKDARSTIGRYVWKGWTADELKTNMNEERYFGSWEKKLNGSKSGYFTGRSSMADVSVFEALDYYKDGLGDQIFEQQMKPYPNLMKLYKLVYNLGRVSTYIEKERHHLPPVEYRKVVDTTLER